MTEKAKQKAVIYVRVSTAAQVAKGQGAESQATRCAEYAKMRGYHVVKTFEDKAVSGSLVERPGMKELLAYLREHRRDNIRVIIDDISRLARGVMTHFALRAAIRSAGGQLESPTREYGEDPDDDILEIIEAAFAGEFRRKNTEQTRNRQEAQFLGGYYPFFAPLGFKKVQRDGGGKIMVRDEPLASIIQEALAGYASGRFQTQAEVKRFLESQPDFPKTRYGTVTNETANRILTRVVYAGMVEKEDWGVSLRPAQHEGLIDFATFEKIQARLNGHAYAPARPDLSIDFPLRGSVACADCERPLTSCWSKSKTGAKHPYYMCFNKECVSNRKSIRRDKLEGEFETLLAELEPSPALIKIAKAIFADAWELQRKQSGRVAEAVRRGVAKADAEIAGLLDKIVKVSSDTAVGAFERRIEQLEREKLVLAERQHNAGKPLRPYGEMFELAMRFLANPSNLWESDRLEDKQTVIRLVFADHLKYDRNEGFRTPKTSIVFRALEGFRAGKMVMAETESDRHFQ